VERQRVRQPDLRQQSHSVAGAFNFVRWQVVLPRALLLFLRLMYVTVGFIMFVLRLTWSKAARAAGT
jgi:hypothetical protein